MKEFPISDRPFCKSGNTERCMDSEEPIDDTGSMRETYRELACAMGLLIEESAW